MCLARLLFQARSYSGPSLLRIIIIMTMIIIYNKKRTRTRTRIQIRIFWPHSAGGHIRTVQITDMGQSQIEGFVEFVTISRDE